jgi:hypothetical protein
MEGAVDSAMNNKSSSGSMSQKEAREARRRKILERGSDRLAFITGEIKSIPPTSPSSQSRDFPAPVRTGDTGLKSLSSAEPRSADSPEGVSDLVDMPVISSSKLQPEVLALDTNARKLTSPTLEPSINPSLSTHKNDGITEGMLAGSSVSVAKPGFSLVNLGHSIDNTQVARVMFSLSFALLLVFHWALRECEHPWGDYLNTWITSWPIATVIVTDITVAIVALLLGFVKVSSSQRKEEKAAGRGGLAVFRDVRFTQALAVGTQLEWALDLSLAAMKTCRSLFLDCCIYFATLVAAASIVQFWLPSICKLLHQ